MTSMDEKQAKLTSDEDVDEILKLALRKQGVGDEDLRARLLASAEELGISESALAQAEEEYLANRADQQEFAEFKYRQKREFGQHFLSYLVTNAMLVAINIFTSGSVTWAVWPILGWGIGLVFHAWGALNSDSESFQEEFEAFRRKKQRRENRPS